MNITTALLLLLCSSIGTFAEELFFGRPVTPVITEKKVFWTRVYRDIDSLHTVVYNRKTLHTYAVVINDAVRYTVDSIKNEGVSPRRIMLKQGRKEFVLEAIRRAADYLFVVDSLRAHHLHNDLRWLPVLESGYLDTMVSPKDARGIWQFIPSTAKRYGLQAHEIADSYKSTHAFVRYFSVLYNEFDDYGVALTAYHHGEGGVRKKLLKRKNTSLESILPDLGFQSRNYYAKYLAIVGIAHAYTNDTLSRNVKKSSTR